MNAINILVTLDENYLRPLRAMLKSFFSSNANESINLYVIDKEISDKGLSDLERFCKHHNDSKVISVKVDDSLFSEAPVNKHFSVAMYYRLLAHKLLPKEIEKVLYLDPDIVVLNDVRTFYDTDISEYLYAAAMHGGITGLSKQINKVRLNNYETEGYYNSGVLLMNLKKHREIIDEKEIFEFIGENKWWLVLPDQDVLNALYGEHILPIDEIVYNYDVERYESYRLVSGLDKDLQWIMYNTVFVHFCGKSKPWQEDHKSKFGILYNHYDNIATKLMIELEEEK